MNEHNWIVLEDGILYYEHETRMFEGIPDRFYKTQYFECEIKINDLLGWASRGCTVEIAREKLKLSKESCMLGSISEKQPEMTQKELDQLVEYIASVPTTEISEDWHVDYTVIGIEAEGCNFLSSNYTKDFACDDKHVKGHYVAISAGTDVLDNASANQKILIPKTNAQIPMQSLLVLKDIPKTDICYILVGHEDLNNSALASLVAHYMRTISCAVVGFVIAPAKQEISAYENFQSFIRSTNVTLPLSKRTAKTYISKTMECLIDVFAADGMICVDFSDILTVLEWNRRREDEQELNFGTLSLLGYGIAYGDNNSDRAKRAGTQALQSIVFPENKGFGDVCGAIYSIRASKEIYGDEVGEIGDMIENLVPSEANVIFGNPFIKEDNILEVQILVILND